MSPAEVLALSGPAAPPPVPGETADAAAFEGLLARGAEGRPRGLLGVGRRLGEQVEAETARLGDTVAGGPLVLPGLLSGQASKSDDALINPGPGAGGGDETPLVNPGPPPGKTGDALINPGPAAKSDGALVNPGPASVEPDAPRINPGPPVQAKGEGAQVLPGSDPIDPAAAVQALQTLAQAGEAVRAEAATTVIRQAVGQAPETEALLVPPPAPDPVLDAAAPIEAAEAPRPASSTAQASSAPSTSSTPQADPRAADVASEARVSDPVAPEGPAAGERSDAPPPRPLSVEAAPLAVRTDAAPLPRLALDAVAHLSAQIIRRLEGRATRFDMELNPAELGRVEVRLDIDSEGRLAARLAFDNPAAAAEMRGRVDELRRDLEQAGFHLGEDALSFADREGGRERRDGLPDGARSLIRSAEAADLADAAAQPALRALTRLGLDVRV